MLENLKAWFSDPLNNGISAPKWFAFVGLMLIIAALWGLIIRQLKEAAS